MSILWESLLQKHQSVQKLPNSSTSTPFKCNECNEKLKLKGKIQWSSKIAEICNEIPAYKLQKIVKPSTTEHPRNKGFSCNVCGKRFQTRTDLERHILIHNEKKPFSCDICGKKFSRKDALSKHASVHTGKEPFSCEVCSKTFSQKYALRHHACSNNGEKSFS
ncbi:hypothetical protein CDAR_232221, partial [Caerostris darwini]